MAFYPTNTNLNTLYELNNLSHNIVYVEDTGPPAPSGIGGSMGGQSYPVTVTAVTPNITVNVSGNTITGYYSDAFDNQIKYRTVDDKFITVTKWYEIAYAIANETLSELYYYHADTRSRITYSYVATANGNSQTYTINLDNDWLAGRNQLIKYCNLNRYQQKILMQWINNTGDKVPWLNNVLSIIDWENSVL